jgi:ATP-dependent RNA helicase DeaD
VAARRTALFKARILKTLQDEDLDVYLALVEDLAEESGKDLAEIAAAAIRLARGNKPLDVVPTTPEPEPAGYPLPAITETVMLRLDAGRNAGIRPADIVGAIANEANLPGKHIGPIEIFDDYSVVGVPAEFQAQVLTAMTGATVRGQAANIRLATPHDSGPRPKSARRDKPARRTPARETTPDYSVERAAAARLRIAQRSAPPKAAAESRKKPYKRKSK